MMERGSDDLRLKISRAEEISRALEPDAADRASVRESVLAYSEQFLDGVNQLPAYVTTTDKGEGLFTEPIGETGIDIDKAISLISDNVDTPGLNPASGGHLGYIPGGGIYYSALGDYLAD